MSHEKWLTHQALLRAVKTAKREIDQQFVIDHFVSELTIAADDLIANEAQVAEELMIVSLAVSESTFFVVPMAQKGLLAFGTHEMLNVPMLAEGGDDALLNWPTTSAADWNSHSIVTAQAVKLVHVVRGEAGSALDLARRWIQLDAAAGAVEVITVEDFSAEAQWRTIDESMALLAWIFPDLRGFDAGIAAMAQGAIIVPYEARVGQLLGAQLTTEALRMPARLHRLDDTPDDDFVALVAEWRVEDSEILLAVLAALELVEDSILEGSEALRAPKSEEFSLITSASSLIELTYTKHWMCHSCPLELTIFSWASKPSSHRVQDIVSKLMLGFAGTLKRFTRLLRLLDWPKSRVFSFDVRKKEAKNEWWVIYAWAACGFVSERSQMPALKLKRVWLHRRLCFALGYTFHPPPVNFERDSFSQLSLHVFAATDITEYLKASAARRTAAVISTFWRRCVGDFIVFISITQSVVDQHLPTNVVVVDVTIRVGDSTLEERRVLYWLERELRLRLFAEQKIHRVGLKFRRVLSSRLRESREIAEFLIGKHKNWI